MESQEYAVKSAINVKQGYMKTSTQVIAGHSALMNRPTTIKHSNTGFVHVMKKYVVKN